MSGLVIQFDVVTYQAFREAKIAIEKPSGFHVDLGELNPKLKDFVRPLVQWALLGGRRGVFSAYGLHKTSCQLEILRQVNMRSGGRVLICAPLNVIDEFFWEAAQRFTGDCAIKLQFIQSDAEMPELPERALPSAPNVSDPNAPYPFREAPYAEGSLRDSVATIYITNYETVREGKLNLLQFEGISLDEADFLRSFGSKSFGEFLFGDAQEVPYRFVATATPSPNDFIELLAYAQFLGVMDIAEAKAQPLDAKILTPHGWAKMGDIAIGDLVISQSGFPTTVEGVFPQGDRPIFRVEFSDGSSTECDGDHLWLTQTQYERNNHKRFEQRNGVGSAGIRFWTTKTASQIADTLMFAANGHNHSIPLVAPIQFPERPVAIDPWLLGYLIGNAHIRETSVVVSTADEWVVEQISGLIEKDDLHLRRTTQEGCDYSITTTGSRGGRGPASNPLLNALRSYALAGKVANEKVIPDDYLFNSPSVRLAILQGLLDSDGTISERGNNLRHSTASEELASQVRFLIQSLGGTAKTAKRATDKQPCFLTAISLPNDVAPFRLARKAARFRPRVKRFQPMRYITRVAPVGVKPAQCIAVADRSHLYVTDDCVVTHNTRFFLRDSAKADNLTINPAKEEEFWHWVASWGCFLQSPSDLGFSDEGYIRPALDVRWHEVSSGAPDLSGFPNAQEMPANGKRPPKQARMFAETALGVVGASREKRNSIEPRIAKMMELRAEDLSAHRILWHDLEDERLAIVAATGAIDVHGGQTGPKGFAERRRRVAGFKNGEIPELAAKPVMLGGGINFQKHCHWAIFLGVTHKLRDFLQAIHRVDRFGQLYPVRIDIIHTEAERPVVENLKRKWEQDTYQRKVMQEIIKKYGLSSADMAKGLQVFMGVERRIAEGPNWKLVNEDAVLYAAEKPTGKTGLILTSIPFANQYRYSNNYADFGHSDDADHFFEQMDFLTPNLLRMLIPGRVCAVHVKDRAMDGKMTGLGYQEIYPFMAHCLLHFKKHGFSYMGAKVIVTDVVRENWQTYRLGYSERCKDASRMGSGLPEYLLLFRKPPTDHSNGYADIQAHTSKEECTRGRWQFDAHAFWRSRGDRALLPEEFDGLTVRQIYHQFRNHSLVNEYDHDLDVAIADYVKEHSWLPPTFMLLQPQSWHPDVWTDIFRAGNLNSLQVSSHRAKHICPLPYDIVDRAIKLYSMPGEEVFDPFSGMGTVPVRAAKLARFGEGTDLHTGYWADSVHYAERLEDPTAQPTLLDLAETDLGDPNRVEVPG